MKKKRFLRVLITLVAIGIGVYLFWGAVARMLLLSPARLLCVAAQGSKEPAGGTKLVVESLMASAARVGGEDGMYAKMLSVIANPHENSLWRAEALEFLEMWPMVAKGRHLSPEEVETLRNVCYKSIADRSAGWEFREAAIRFTAMPLISRTEEALAKSGFVEEKNEWMVDFVERAKMGGFANPCQRDVDSMTAILSGVIADPNEDEKARYVAVEGVMYCLQCAPSASVSWKVREGLRDALKNPKSSDWVVWRSVCVLYGYFDLAHWDVSELREMKRRLQAITDKDLAGGNAESSIQDLDRAIRGAE